MLHMTLYAKQYVDNAHLNTVNTSDVAPLQRPTGTVGLDASTVSANIMYLHSSPITLFLKRFISASNATNAVLFSSSICIKVLLLDERKLWNNNKGMATNNPITVVTNACEIPPDITRGSPVP